MSGDDGVVGAAARAWLTRATEVESDLARAVGLADRIRKEIGDRVSRASVRLPPNGPRQGRAAVPPDGTVAVILDPDPGGLIGTVEQSAPVERPLAPLVPEAQRFLTLLRQALPVARPTGGRIRFAFTGRTRKDAAVAALRDVTRWVTEAESSGVRDRCRALLDAPPTASVAFPFTTDPRYVVARVGAHLQMQGPASAPFLLTWAELATARHIAAYGPAALRQRPALVEKVRETFGRVQRRMVRSQLADMPVTVLRDATGGRIRFKALESEGFRTVADVVRASPSRIAAVHGISDTAARQVVAAARQLENAVRDDLRFRIDLDRSDELVTDLLAALHRLLAHDAAFDGKGDELQACLDLLRPLAALPEYARSVTLYSPSTETSALMAEVMRRAEWYHRSGLHDLLPRLSGPRKTSATDPAEVWRDFENRSAEYYAALGEIVDLGTDEEAAAGFMPQEIVDKIHALRLDDSMLRVSLRGYQSFGARYALVQRQVILGDEMGLGKTIQALAVMCHLWAEGRSHFLVVCPASVLINWVREIASHSGLKAFQVHGADRSRVWQAWQRQGGVAVTTFDTLRTLKAPERPIALLTVDEAHYVKNPATKRAAQIAEYVRRAERTLFMTGTPMENRVDEFKNLITHLQPEIAKQVSGTDGVAGARRFRIRVAPVYLRRNTQDVLQELPEMVQTDEWEEFTTGERVAYRGRVQARDFMGMRRTAFIAVPEKSAKIARLLEIVDEASENGTKVIVFSYFRDVLDVVMAALGPRAIGPLTGSLAAARRQELVDRFTRTRGGAVLVSQIQAGGVGLNMQAGSVVVLCEPQVKPSLEVQAIARAHRMGQVRTVQVHRLLITDSVDQRMLEILDSKRQLFDAYARESTLADISPEAVDVSEQRLAREVIAAEQARMAAELAEELARQDQDPDT